RTLEVHETPAVKNIAIKNLPTILEACNRLEKFIGEVRSHAFHVLQRGEIIQGYKLVPKRSTRKWANPEKIEQLAKKKFGDIVISPGSFLSPAQFEKTLALFSDEEAEEA